VISSDRVYAALMNPRRTKKESGAKILQSGYDCGGSNFNFNFQDFKLHLTTPRFSGQAESNSVPSPRNSMASASFSSSLPPFSLYVLSYCLDCWSVTQRWEARHDDCNSPACQDMSDASSLQHRVRQACDPCRYLSTRY
jgi:hypothetical protein